MNNENKDSFLVGSLPIETLINRDDFVRLEVYTPPDNSIQSHWEFTFESKTKDDEGLYVFGECRSTQPFFKLYKLKL